jgi:hypothetical protein
MAEHLSGNYDSHAYQQEILLFAITENEAEDLEGLEPLFRRSSLRQFARHWSLKAHPSKGSRFQTLLQRRKE